MPLSWDLFPVGQQDEEGSVWKEGGGPNHRYIIKKANLMN